MTSPQPAPRRTPARERPDDSPSADGRVVSGPVVSGPVVSGPEPSRPATGRSAPGPSAGGRSAIRARHVALIDLLDRLLTGGVVISGDIRLGIADVDLVTVSLRALVASVATVEPPGGQGPPARRRDETDG